MLFDIITYYFLAISIMCQPKGLIMDLGIKFAIGTKTQLYKKAFKPFNAQTAVFILVAFIKNPQWSYQQIAVQLKHSKNIVVRSEEIERFFEHSSATIPGTTDSASSLSIFSAIFRFTNHFPAPLSAGMVRSPVINRRPDSETNTLLGFMVPPVVLIP